MVSRLVYILVLGLNSRVMLLVFCFGVMVVSMLLCLIVRCVGRF